MSLVQAVPATRSFASIARDYVSLLKLRVVVLLDATALGVMVPAAHGHPRVASVLAVLAGGAPPGGGGAAAHSAGVPGAPAAGGTGRGGGAAPRRGARPAAGCAARCHVWPFL